MAHIVKEETFNIWGAEFTRTQLLAHLTKCHALLDELSTVNDWEMPTSLPRFIERAIELRREVASAAVD